MNNGNPPPPPKHMYTHTHTQPNAVQSCPLLVPQAPWILAAVLLTGWLLNRAVTSSVNQRCLGTRLGIGATPEIPTWSYCTKTKTGWDAVAHSRSDICLIPLTVRLSFCRNLLRPIPQDCSTGSVWPTRGRGSGSGSTRHPTSWTTCGSKSKRSDTPICHTRKQSLFLYDREPQHCIIQSEAENRCQSWCLE